MKLSDVKPCASCKGPLREQGIGTWYVIRVTQAMLNPRACNQVMGLMQMFNGALGLAEVFAPDATDAILVMGDKEPALMDEIHICLNCFYSKPIGPLI